MSQDHQYDPQHEVVNSLNLTVAVKALSLLAIDPQNLRGLVLKGRSSPIRKELFNTIPEIFSNLKFQKIHPLVMDSELFGGLDFAKTFETGKIEKTRGYLNRDDSVLLLSMAERLEANLVGKLTSAMDKNSKLCFIASDEGIDDEKISQSLTERMAFSVSLEGIRYTDMNKILFNFKKIETARRSLQSISIQDHVISTLTRMSFKLGIDSLRAPILASYAARASAAFSGHDSIKDEDIIESVRLVLSSKATVIPDHPEADHLEPQEKLPPENEPQNRNGKNEQETFIPTDILLEAIRSSLSPEVLKNLIDGRKTSKLLQSNSGAGQKTSNNRRGRPLPSRAGKIDSTKRIDLIETLRVAAPWQQIRQKNAKKHKLKIIVRSTDIRIKRHQEQSDRLIIFTVDASGTLALGRLGETKGAIEILLVEAYSRRDQVALISFRGDSAKIELPPTRSLVQTKKRLAGLPAGGGTPLASGLSVSFNLAMQSRIRGLTPTLAILTDGKGNIDLHGAASRSKAKLDTDKCAQQIREEKIPCMVIDSSNRPQEPAKALADQLDATYLALPRANSKRLSKAISKALG